MPRLRFTVRRMMLAVAIVATVIGFLRFAADRHDELVSTYAPGPGTGMHPGVHWKAIAFFYVTYVALPALAAALVIVLALRRYQRASARSSRLPVAPDPPEPE